MSTLLSELFMVVEGFARSVALHEQEQSASSARFLYGSTFDEFFEDDPAVLVAFNLRVTNPIQREHLLGIEAGMHLGIHGYSFLPPLFHRAQHAQSRQTLLHP